MRLRQNPAAMTPAPAAATVGSAVVTAALRRALGQMSLSPVDPHSASVAVGGYVVHEVHVIHHVVHHVIGPAGD